jgi:hypothetical protein
MRVKDWCDWRYNNRLMELMRTDCCQIERGVFFFALQLMAIETILEASMEGHVALRMSAILIVQKLILQRS